MTTPHVSRLILGLKDGRQITQAEFNTALQAAKLPPPENAEELGWTSWEIASFGVGPTPPQIDDLAKRLEKKRGVLGMRFFGEPGQPLKMEAVTDGEIYSMMIGQALEGCGFAVDATLVHPR